MSRDVTIIVADDVSDLGIKYTPPSEDYVHQVLWGVTPGTFIPPEELDGATIGKLIDDMPTEHQG